MINNTPNFFDRKPYLFVVIGIILQIVFFYAFAEAIRYQSLGKEVFCKLWLWPVLKLWPVLCGISLQMPIFSLLGLAFSLNKEKTRAKMVVLFLNIGWLFLLAVIYAGTMVFVVMKYR